MGKIKIDLQKGKIAKDKDIIVGIDLGTTNSLVAYTDEDGKSHVVKNSDNKHALTPSVIHFDQKNQIIVGEKAIQQLDIQPERTIHSVKRLMGKSYQDVASYSELLSYHIIENEDEDQLVRIEIDGKHYTPIELSAEILKELKNKIEKQLDCIVSRCVITVPAYFNDAQRQATRDAGKLAGLDVMRIINEPTAAALAYGLGLGENDEKIVAVYDLGGGTFDISILQIQDQVFEVLSTHGDTFLGGDDMDRAIMNYWIENTELDNDEIKSNKSLSQSLRLLAEKAKKNLSNEDQFEGELAGVTLTITKDTFVSIIQPIIKKTIQSCQQALSDAKVSKSEIDEILLVGGSTRVPAVKEAVSVFFDKKADDSLHPDEVVALGAAVQASILSGQNKDMLLLDITPLSLGIETMGGLMDTIIARNSKIPNAMAREYTTSVDGQKNLKISVYQGERELVEHNRKLGEFILSDIPPMPAGIPKIEVRFILDANGILTVQAMEKRSGLSQKITIKSQYGISEEEMAKMLMDSIQNAEADLATKALIDAKNEAKNVLQGVERFINQNGEWLDKDQVKSIKEMASLLHTKTQGSDKDAIYSEMDKLNDFTKPLAEIVMNNVVRKSLEGKNIESEKQSAE